MSNPDHPGGRHPVPPGRPDHTSGPGPERPTRSGQPAQPDHAPHHAPAPAPAPAAEARPAPTVRSHRALKALLGAWALAACSAEEAAAVEHHLGGCGACAEEAVMLREAVGLLHPAESLDLDPALRARVLEASLARRPPRIPVPGWATPYDAETARLDALLQDIGAPEWHAPVRLRWYAYDRAISRRTTVAAVLGHLLSVDGLVAVALGLDDPLGAGVAPGLDPVQRTEAYWRTSHLPPTIAIRTPWRDQSHRLVRTAAFAAGGGAGDEVSAVPVPYGDFTLPLCDALVERAFECWIHASDIAAAVDYPYGPPVPRHLRRIIDLTARRLPDALAGHHRAGAPRTPIPPFAPQGHAVDDPGRVLRLEIEGAGGGEWLISLDGHAAGSDACQHAREVAHVALDGFEFCRLAAGHVTPEEATAGSTGNRDAVTAFLVATASLSRM